MTPRQLFVVVGGATLLTSLNFSLIFVAFGDINKTFEAHPTVTSWALTGFSITVASLLVPAGWMADRFGRERIFIRGIALFTAGSALVAGAPWVGLLVAGRVVQASGLALESSAALPILLAAFPSSRRATVVGTLGATGGAAAAIGPVIGGALVDTIGWRWTFALNVPAGLAICAIVRWRLPMARPDRPASAPPDRVGVAALAAGMGLLVLSITQVDDWGVGDVRTLAAAAGAAVLLGLVVRRSRRHPDPILYLPMFRIRSYRQGVILNVLIAGTFAGTFFSFIRLLTDGWGLSVFRAGVAVALIPFFGGPLSMVAGRIADRHGPRVVIVPGALLIAAAGLLFAARATDERNIVGLWIPVACLYGIGVGFGHAACHASALREVPGERLGIAGAMSRIGMDVGGVITVAVAVALVTSSGDTVAGVRRVTTLVSVVCLVGAALATRLRRTR